MSLDARPVLEARGLSAHFEQWPLFEAVDLEIRPQECVVLTGDNELACTALLECVAGVREPSSGFVRSAGGYAVWHDEGFPTDRAIGEVIDEWLDDAGIRGTDAPTLLTGIELAHRLGHEGWAMSAGERRRAALATAFAIAPPLLIVDEPERGLDAAALRWAADRFEAHRAGGAAVLIATHHSRFEQLATRTVSLPLPTA